MKMKDFDHPNIVSLIGVCIATGSSPYIVMPFMANGSLLSYLKQQRHRLTIANGAEQDLVSSRFRMGFEGACTCDALYVILPVHLTIREVFMCLVCASICV